MEEVKSVETEEKKPECVCAIILIENFDGSLSIEPIAEKAMRQANPEDIVGMLAKAQSKIQASTIAAMTTFGIQKENKKPKLHTPWRR